MFKILLIFFASFLTFVKASCPEGSFEWQTNCFFFKNETTGFADAQSNCATFLNGHLTSIHDGFTNALLAQKGQIYFPESTVTDFWIGLTTLMLPGNWTWMDGINLDFIKWASGEPQNVSTNCAILSIADGYWRSDDCFKAKPYVCRIDKSIFETTTITPTTTTTKYPIYANCTYPFTYFEPTHSCYGVGNLSYPLNWSDSELYCEEFGGHLASVHSWEERMFLTAFVNVLQQGIWSGAFSNDGGHSWKWSDGTPWDYNFWQPGYPFFNSSSCGGLNEWNLVEQKCDIQMRKICKVPLKGF